MTESYLHLWESRLREAVTILERVTIQKLQAAVNDVRCIMPAAKGGQLGGRRAVVGSSWAVGRVMEACKSAEEWCRGTESNCRHQPFQGCALPTELPRHGRHDNKQAPIVSSKPDACATAVDSQE